MKKSGFTLAEVLITLVIIGVVASMTIPALLTNTGKQELKTGLKKAVSVFNQAITLEGATTSNSMAEIANNLNAFNEFMFRNFNVDPVKSGPNPLSTGWITGDGMVYVLSNALGSGWNGSAGKQSAACNSDLTSCYLYVDVNGLSKGPNKCAGPNANCSELDWAKEKKDIQDRYVLRIYSEKITPVGAAVNVFYDDQLK